MWHNAAGFPLFIELLDTDPTKTEAEQLTEARLRPLTKMQRSSLLWDMLADKVTDNAAPEALQISKGAVWPPLPREEKDNPFDYGFGKEAKAKRVKTAKESEGDGSVRAAATIAAHNDVAVVSFLETYLPSVQKMFEYMLYVHDTAAWSLRDERIEMLALLRRLRKGLDQEAMKEAITDTLGEQVEQLTSPGEELVPELKEFPHAGTRRGYCKDGEPSTKLGLCQALSNSLVDETPMLARQTKQLCLLQRDELVRLMADAQARIEPLIKQSQLKTAEKHYNSAMPKDDQQAVSREVRHLAVTSPKKDNKRKKPDDWGGGGRGAGTRSRGKQHQRYNHYDNPKPKWPDPDQATKPKGKPNGKGTPWKKKNGKGRGKGRGK